MQEMLRIGGGKTLSWQRGTRQLLDEDRELMIHHFLPSAFIPLVQGAHEPVPRDTSYPGLE
jgi:hypothetical protein